MEFEEKMRNRQLTYLERQVFYDIYCASQYIYHWDSRIPSRASNAIEEAGLSEQIHESFSELMEFGLYIENTPYQYLEVEENLYVYNLSDPDLITIYQFELN